MGCKRSGMGETWHIMIKLICCHWMHASCLEKAPSCVGCKEVYIPNKRRLFLRARAYAGRQVPEEFSAWKWSIGISGYLKMIISLDNEERIEQETSFVEYGIFQHPLVVAARRDDWQECERYAERRWKEIEYMEERRLEEKEATRKMECWILSRLEGDEGVECD